MGRASSPGHSQHLRLRIDSAGQAWHGITLDLSAFRFNQRSAASRTNQQPSFVKHMLAAARKVVVNIMPVALETSR